MVTLDIGADGLVLLRLSPPRAAEDEAAYLAALDRIAAQPGPFVLLASFSGHQPLSPAGERAQALWFKATRAQMNAACRALAMVRPGETGARSEEVFGKLWSFPVRAFADEAAARSFLATVPR